MAADSPSSTPLRLGFLLSGSGRTLENLLGYLRDHPGLGEIVSVISDRPNVLGLERAERWNIPSAVLPCRNADESYAIFERFDAAEVDYVLCGGFLRLLRVPTDWENRVLNIHPSLIPKFSGKGFYGERVHKAVIQAREQESGCTVHFVDNIYDHGPVLLQETVPVLPDDTPDTLAARVFEAECRAFPRAVETLAQQHTRERNA